MNPPVRLVVIGCSAGGTRALCHLLRALPPEYPLPVAIVLHLAAHSSTHLRVFNEICALSVCEPCDKEPIRPGRVYFAPADYHLQVEAEGYFALSNDAPMNYSRPSIDVLFESAADAFGDQLAGLVLTGANADGSAGLARVGAKGGQIAVQDPDSAEYPYMPRAALDLAGPELVLDLDRIGAWLAGLEAVA